MSQPFSHPDAVPKELKCLLFFVKEQETHAIIECWYVSVRYPRDSSSRVALSNLSQRPHPMSSSTYPLVMTNIAMV